MESGDTPNSYSPWLEYVQRLVEAVDSGKRITLGPSAAPPVPPAVSASASGGPKVVFCSPHPDDESLSGALALRLRLEANARVTNIAITLGSDEAQRERRRRELRSACRVLGFELVIPAEPGAAVAAGFESITLTARKEEPKEWAARVRSLSEVFDQEQPEAVFAPHHEDFNSTHVATHRLVTEALAAHLARRASAAVVLIETEFWHPLAEPNLMVELTPEQLAIQLTAAAEHGGEMRRNPYQLLQPCRLMDNVRRGSEVVGGQGAAAQPFTLAELYRVSFQRGRNAVAPRPGGRMLPASEPATLEWFWREFHPES
ncbi:MAG TPA: PIG-L family deacetylase [Terriglobia bacterium]|nr:PIG-L family deacetylase [Terriglobia bacterium]